MADDLQAPPIPDAELDQWYVAHNGKDLTVTLPGSASRRAIG
jgi:hypothetical protein